MDDRVLYMSQGVSLTLGKVFELHNLELPQTVVFLLEDFFLRMFNQDELIEDAVEVLMKDVFSLERSVEGRYYRKDEDGIQQTVWGFIVAPDGVAYHLTDQYSHGLTIAAIDPKLALENGYVPPNKHLPMSVYEYQDFEFGNAHKDDGINYLRFGCGFYERLSGDLERVTSEQLKTLKSLLKINGYMDCAIETDTCTYKGGNKLLADIDKHITSAKMGTSKATKP